MDTKMTRFVMASAALFLMSVIGSYGNQEFIPGGELRIKGAEESARTCPLKHTEVNADIIGYVSRTTVKQVFENTTDEKIEAVYVFPLPEHAAVDDMTMIVGDRTIKGEIMRRPEAKKVYEEAKKAGHVASLLDQERPNIFTQSVANIEPGATVIIEISYLETLSQEDGVFEYVFPMVVGPRYMPGNPVGYQGTGWAPDTTEVPDASRISPPWVSPETRAGHNISVRIFIDAGMEIVDLTSVLHEVNIERPSVNLADVTLKNKDEIPNRDFILRYRTAGDEITDAFLVYSDERGTFFTMILQPPARVEDSHIVPKEMIFVIDRSGSMSGFPIEKAKETMRLCINGMNPDDTFNLLSFSGGTGRCFENPATNTPENVAKALQYLNDLYGSGGTEMMPAILEALGGQNDPDRIRIVCFMTDGYIGNDYSIIDAVKKHAGTARVFAFGIGNSVNRFLLDNMAHEGRGEVAYVTLANEANDAAQRFYKRINAPVMTDISIDWGTLSVTEVFPERIPDLFDEKPIMLHGRFEEFADGTITLHGTTASRRYEEEIPILTAQTEPAYECLASLWARAKVDYLMNKDIKAAYSRNLPDTLKNEIISVALVFRLLTQFTSFVAVEYQTITEGGEVIQVPVPTHLGSGLNQIGFVATATQDTLLLLLGVVIILSGVGLLLLRRRWTITF